MILFIKKFLLSLLVGPFLLAGISIENRAPTISIAPEKVMQGEPIMIQAEGVTTFSSVKKITLNDEELPIFFYDGKPTALYGFDLKKTPGKYLVIATLENGKTFENTMTLEMRKKVEAPLGIPEKLGGNTPAGVKNVTSSLASENMTLASIRSGTKSFWTEKFGYPLAKVFVTDPYGYFRETGSATITHKGTDFRAPEGTEVFAMNQGFVRLVRDFNVYGKTVVIDHGLGLMTFYMHLSKTNVREGEVVSVNQSLGFSGETGYAESPHLHISVRIRGVSIDPMKFMSLFR